MRQSPQRGPLDKWAPTNPQHNNTPFVASRTEIFVATFSLQARRHAHSAEESYRDAIWESLTMQGAIGYLRVSSREEGGSGLGLAAQRHEIEDFGARS